MNLLNELIDNQNQDTDKCQKVVGSLEALYALADFHERHARELKLIGASELLKFCSGTFSEEELKGFQMGLAAFPAFLSECYKQRQIIENKKEV